MQLELFLDLLSKFPEKTPSEKHQRTPYKRSINIVKASHSEFYAEIHAVIFAKFFGDQFFEAVSVLRLSRPSITFSEARIVGVFLDVLWVHTSTRRIEKSFHGLGPS